MRSKHPTRIGVAPTDDEAKVPVLFYRCQRAWHELSPTPDEHIRHCDACNQSVHRVLDTAGLQELIAARGCAALTHSADDLMWVGGVESTYKVDENLNWEG